MDMQSAISTINNPVVGAIAAAFGFGAFLNEVRAGIKAVFTWIKSSQGQEAVQDIEAALPIVINVLNQSKHPQAAAIAAQVQQVVASAQDAAAPPAAPIGGDAVTPGKLGVWFFLVGLLALGAGLSADTTTTARGFMATPSLLAQGALYQLNTDGTLTPTAESVAGMQYSFYWGTYTESTEGKINFEPLVFITPFSIGVSTGTGSTRPVYSVAVGYKYFGVSAAWNLGANQERPLVGLMASIPLDPLLNGLVWDIGGTAAKYFPGASF